VGEYTLLNTENIREELKTVPPTEGLIQNLQISKVEYQLEHRMNFQSI